MDIVEALKEKGLRPTPHRVRLAEKVLRKHCHFSADEIGEWATNLKRPLSRATVYNILNEFVAVGLLRSMHLSSVGKTIYDSNTDNHYHFYDADKGTIHDLAPEKLKLNLGSFEGYQIDEVSILITGRKA